MTLTQIKPAGLSKPVDFADNEQIRLGTGNDLLIYHNGTSSEIESATGSLRLHGAQNQAIIFRNHDDTANVAVFNVDDATHLYFDSAHKFSTNSTGIRVVGNCIPGSNDSGQLGTSSIRWQELNITDVIDVSDNGKIRMGDSDDLQIYHDGNNSAINDKGTGSLYIQGSNNIYLRDYDTSENHIVMTKDGSVELYHDGTKQCETASDGLAFPSGKGINFNATADASGTGVTAGSETLDDYEEGEWTPTLNTGLSLSYSKGRYVKIGAMVYAFFEISFPASGSNNHTIINNLPFTSINHDASCGGTARDYQQFDISDGPIYHVPKNNTQIQFYKDGGTTMNENDAAARNFRACSIYQAAS